MNHRHPPRLRVASLARLATTTLALILLPLHSGHAGSLQVAPILLEFGHAQASQTLWLTNSGTEPLRAQIRVQHWTQDEGRESLQPSNTLLASPPLVDIEAGRSQLVRLLQASPATQANEDAFRLIVDELPGASSSASSSLHFLLRYSIPVFVLPEGATPLLERSGRREPTDAGQLQGNWSVQGGSATLSLRNHGSQRIRISQLSWAPTAGPPIDITPGLLGYVLAGRQMRWTLPVPTALPATGTLHARLNDDPAPQALSQVVTGR
ncbi:MAG TPA: fimbria/pilus periplasmic chaperone [Stenotrophomonas sp.]